ncbi:aquaporin AQPAe.a-like [Hylaeus anthracinus]|uniref:aquaporin AQPAe.a-like n=1 Tax=Hylaeus anthracinus TaxID=313031 RepID=UPI0023B96AD9|nr:aquaporin AQPAe.a-like [Hylaeus anthracinus]
MSRGCGFKRLMQGEGEMKNTILTALAEMMGTSILVLMGCMGCVGTFGVVPSHFQIAVTFGLAVMIVIQSVGHISHAHVNPAITVGSVVLGKKTLLEGLIYLLSQMIGGIVGFGMLRMMTPGSHLSAKGADEASMFCVTDIHQDLSAIQGLILEGTSTGILMLVTCGVWDKRNVKNTDSVPIRFGLTVAALALAFGPYTGCSMNPARSLGPAVWNSQWSHHWIYWFGPIGGALLASFTYKTVFGVADEEEEETGPEAVALSGVDTQKAEA